VLGPLRRTLRRGGAGLGFDVRADAAVGRAARAARSLGRGRAALALGVLWCERCGAKKRSTPTHPLLLDERLLPAHRLLGAGSVLPAVTDLALRGRASVPMSGTGDVPTLLVRRGIEAAGGAGPVDVTLVHLHLLNVNVARDHVLALRRVGPCAWVLLKLCVSAGAGLGALPLVALGGVLRRDRARGARLRAGRLLGLGVGRARVAGHVWLYVSRGADIYAEVGSSSRFLPATFFLSTSFLPPSFLAVMNGDSHYISDAHLGRVQRDTRTLSD
jgi:hypothetical protein